jgi:hypothetical protein
MRSIGGLRQACTLMKQPFLLPSLLTQNIMKYEGARPFNAHYPPDVY